MTMQETTHPQVPEPLISERENARIVELIEQMERDEPFCSCGTANGAVEHDDVVWLECNSLRHRQPGVRGFIARLGAAHTHRRIAELSGSLSQH